MMTNEDRAVMQQIVEQHPMEVLSRLIAQPTLSPEERRLLEHARIDLRYAVDVQVEAEAGEPR